MISLSIGYLCGGYLSTWRRRPRDVGYLLLAQGISALVPLLSGDAIIDTMFAVIHDVRYGAFLSALILFFFPTTISGAVSPYSVRLLVDDVRISGHKAGLLYFASTIGSTAGTILTAFYLVLWLDIDTILALLISMSCAVGAMSWLLPQS